MECQALGACPDDSLPDLLDVLGRVSGEDARPMHQLEMVIEGPSYARNIKGPQLRLVHDLRHLDSDSLPGSHARLQPGTYFLMCSASPHHMCSGLLLLYKSLPYHHSHACIAWLPMNGGPCHEWITMPHNMC